MTQRLGLDQIEGWCQQLSEKFGDRQIVLLNGPLGAGKSELVKKFVQTVTDDLTHSPTFSLINEYQSSDQKIFHIDLYRIESEEDLESIGFWDLFSETKALVFIEWPEKMNLLNLPRDWQQITINISKLEDDQIRAYQVVS